MRALRLGALLPAAAACLALCSCLDFYQTISRDPSGTIAVYFRATVARSLVDLANSMSDSGETFSLDSIVSIGDANSDKVIRALDGTVTSIDDGMNVGIGVQLHIDASSPEDRAIMSAHDDPMVPDITDASITISFPSESTSAEEDDAMEGFLAGHTYRLVIGKDVVPAIPSARLTGEGIDYEPAVTSMGDAYLIEIPVKYVLVNRSGCQLVIGW